MSVATKKSAPKKAVRELKRLRTALGKARADVRLSLLSLLPLLVTVHGTS